MIHNSRTRDTHINDRFRLTHSMKRARHKRVVFDGVGKTNKLGAGDSALLARAFGCVLNQIPDAPYRIHVDARARGRDVHRRAETRGGCQRFRN